MEKITTGVPQGSVIGPLLYVIFTNDMSESVKRLGCLNSAHLDHSALFSKQCSDCGIISTYADDSTYTISHRKREDNQISLERSLDEISLYLNDNKLVINPPKTSLTVYD